MDKEMSKEKEVEKDLTKVRCKLCMDFNSEDSVCIVKKVGVASNKKRMCEYYRYDSSKYKPPTPIPTTKTSWRLKDTLTDETKEKLLKLRESLGSFEPTDSKHPVTGDLSRFTSTSPKDGAN